jgi:hypothetical protein
MRLFYYIRYEKGKIVRGKRFIQYYLFFPPGRLPYLRLMQRMNVRAGPAGTNKKPFLDSNETRSILDLPIVPTYVAELDKIGVAMDNIGVFSFTSVRACGRCITYGYFYPHVAVNYNQIKRGVRPHRGLKICSGSGQEDASRRKVHVTT